MARMRDKDTRYFIEVDLESLKVVRCAYDRKQNLDKGRQPDPTRHRLFLTEGQYNLFVSRCSAELGPVLER